MTDDTPRGSDEPLEFEQFVTDLSRRGFLRGSAVAGVGLAGLGSVSGTVAADEHGDGDDAGGENGMAEMSIPEILNYALTLERLEATYYDMAVGENGVWSESDVERSSVAAQFAEPSLRYGTYQRFVNVRDHEAYHVTLLEQVLDQLGAEVTAPSEFSFPDGVFEDIETFVRFASVVEDLGVAAYAGVAPALAKAELESVDGDTSQLQVTPAALGIHSIEARHAGYFRVLADSAPWTFFGTDVADASIDDPLMPDQVVSRVQPYIGGDDGETEGPATVTFEDQEADDSTVTVAETFLPEGGFVVIHDDSLLEGDALGSVVGVSDYLESGTHVDVSIEVDVEASGETTLIAMPHMDTNDNTTYDFVTSEGEDDGPYVDPDDTNDDGQEVVVDPAAVTFDD